MPSGWLYGFHGYKETKTLYFFLKKTRILDWYKIPVLCGTMLGFGLYSRGLSLGAYTYLHMAGLGAFNLLPTWYLEVKWFKSQKLPLVWKKPLISKDCLKHNTK